MIIGDGLSRGACAQTKSDLQVRRLGQLKATSLAQLNDRIGISMLYLLIIPTMLTAVLTTYLVLREREQSTLETVLVTPILREELLVGKALAAFAPTLVIAYFLFGVFLGAAELFAHPAAVSAIFERSHVLVQLLFTPLLAGWSIWMGIAISARSTDVRAAQQLSVFASLPLLGIVALLSPDVARPRARTRCRTSRRRRVRLAFRRRHLRPRAPHHRQPELRDSTGGEKGADVSTTLKLSREGFGAELLRGRASSSGRCALARLKDLLLAVQGAIARFRL